MLAFVCGFGVVHNDDDWLKKRKKKCWSPLKLKTAAPVFYQIINASLLFVCSDQSAAAAHSANCMAVSYTNEPALLYFFLSQLQRQSTAIVCSNFVSQRMFKNQVMGIYTESLNGSHFSRYFKGILY